MSNGGADVDRFNSSTLRELFSAINDGHDWRVEDAVDFEKSDVTFSDYDDEVVRTAGWLVQAERADNYARLRKEASEKLEQRIRRKLSGINLWSSDIGGSPKKRLRAMIFHIAVLAQLYHTSLDEIVRDFWADARLRFPTRYEPEVHDYGYIVQLLPGFRMHLSMWGSVCPSAEQANSVNYEPMREYQLGGDYQVMDIDGDRFRMYVSYRKLHKKRREDNRGPLPFRLAVNHADNVFRLRRMMVDFSSSLGVEIRSWESDGEVTIDAISSPIDGLEFRVTAPVEYYGMAVVEAWMSAVLYSVSCDTGTGQAFDEEMSRCPDWLSADSIEGVEVELLFRCR